MVEVYDIETLKPMFSYVGFNVHSKTLSKFVISEYQNDLKPLIKHLNDLKGQIGYNNLSFDAQVIQFILVNWDDWLDLTSLEICKLIYNYSQYVINKANNNEFLDYPEWKLIIKQLDLFKIWHFNNKAKMTGLKWVEFSIDFPNIEEMNVPHNIDKLSQEEIEGVLSYNVNDVMATYEFYLITIGQTEHPLYKGIDKINLRKDIQNEFGIKCINYNDVKIGDELNKLGYLTKISKKDDKDFIKYQLKPKNVKTEFTFGDCIPNYVNFKTEKFNLFFNNVRKQKVDLKSKQEFNLEHNGTTYTIMKGGIHSQDKPRIVQPNDNEILRDADIGSQYPNGIRKRELNPSHLSKVWLEQYVDTIQRRLDAKKLYKQTKDPKYQAIQEAYKLALNGGGFGKTGEESSWQYDPFVSMCVTIGNQFEILMLIEMLELNGIHIISANTDGIVSLFDKNLNETYYQTCKEWELIVGNEDLGQLEYADYSLLVQTSVNDYLAIKVGESKPKCKGDFVSEFEIHKNKSARIIPLALQNYYSNKINIEETILKHDNIFDFCLGVKSKSDSKLIHSNPKTNEEIELQKINRYYISTDGFNLLKRMKPLENKKGSGQLDIFGNIDDGTRESEVEAGWLTTIYNKHIIKNIEDYNIDYSFYIQKANKIINNIGK